MATPVTQTTSPWQPIADQLRFAYQEARRLYDRGGPAYYPGQTYVGFAPQTAAALSATQARAQAGSPLTAAAQGAVQRLLGPAAATANPAYAYVQAGARGDHLGANPHLDAIYARAAHQVRDQVNAQFGGAGRVGSGAHADVVARNLGDLASGLYGQAYESERDRQLRSQELLAQLGQQATQAQLDAAQAAPQLAAADYADLDRLLGVGQAHEAQSAAALQDRVQRHNFAQTAEAQRLAQFMALLTGTNYATTRTTAPEPGRADSILGGIRAGVGVAGDLKLDPLIAAIGGGLIGLFG